jgi:hypothetical protein
MLSYRHIIPERATAAEIEAALDNNVDPMIGTGAGTGNDTGNDTGTGVSDGGAGDGGAGTIGGGGGGGGGLGGAGACATPIEEWLVSVNPVLRKYAEGFREYGYDNAGVLALDAGDGLAEALRTLNVKKPHERLLRAAVGTCAAE